MSDNLRALLSRRVDAADAPGMAAIYESAADAIAPPDNEFVARYYDDPAAFARECIAWPDGEALTDYQAAILADLVRHKREAVRGPHGLGKTTIAAIAILWFATTRDAAGRDWKIPATASAWRQLTKFLWPEVAKWSRRLRWDVIGREPFDRRTELQTMALKLTHGEAFAAASDDPALLEGAHADCLLFVYDESKSVPAGTFDATEGAFSGAGSDTTAEAFALAISTPGEPQGRFYEIHSRKAGLEDWHARHVTLADAIAAGRISKAWADQRRIQWGATSSIYLNRVEGEFAASDEDGVVPLAWVEAANRRWEELHPDCTAEQHAASCSYGELTAVGVDVARSGADKTVLALRFGDDLAELRRYTRADTMETTGHVRGVLNGYGGRAVIDVVGVGAGVVDRLRESSALRPRVCAFNASEATTRKDKSGELGFLNCRAASWWHLREILDPDSGVDVALPADDKLIGDLVAPKWKVTSAGRIQVESKDEIKKRLGRSPDDGDAVVMAFWPGAEKKPVPMVGPMVMTRPSYWRPR